MNNCDNKDGGSSSEIQHTLSTTPTTITTVSSSTTTSEQTTATNSTTTTSVVDNQETFYTSNENLINNSTTAAAEQEEHETECADNTNKIGETTPVAAVVSDTNNTEVTAATTTIPTVSYAAITAMDTATATAFMSSCYTANKFEIENSFASVSVSVAPNCDTNSSTSTETTTTTFSDNELITKQPSTTPTPRAPSVTTSEIVVAVAATPISGEIGKDVALVRSVGVVDEELLTSNTKSPIPSMIEKLENKENVSLENESIRMDNSNCGDIACKSLKSPMLLRKKIHTLTTTSSEPILNQCGSGNSSGYTAESPSCSGLTTTNASSGMISRRVSFPKSDDALVTGYLEPANPWEHVYMTNSISEIAELYIQSCQKHNTTPIQSVLDHLKAIEFNSAVRQPNLSLKSLKLLPADCEALEEIFKRVQYKAIDISSCDLNETAASALFDMFEYYEATNELDISSNADGMTSRGWTSCIYLVSHSRALQMLNAQGNPLSKNCADNLGSALNSSNLHTLKLEHCGLKGHPIDSLCIKLRNNKILRELWLAHNDLTCQDADKIGQLLRTNHYLQLIDISNNNIKDEGVTKIVKALIEQSTELARQQAAAAAQRLEWRAAFAEAEYKKRQQSLNSSTNGVKNGTTATNGTGTSTDDDTTSGDSDASPAEEEEEDDEDDDADDADVDTDANDAEDDDGTTTDNGGVSKAEDDDDDEDTVKTTTLKTAPAINGQSKLDKLLSMNNSDSSEDVPTDTVAASDISISDDIFDSTSRVAVITSTPIVDSAIEQQERPAPQNNINNNETAAVTTIFEASDMVAETAAEGATIVTPTKALDVNKNATIKLDDFDDTHSTDSAFESSSDGDISRHLPEEFASRFDGKDDVETATIATEALTTPTPTPPPVLEISPQPEPPPPPPPPPQLMTTPKPIDVSCSLLATSASPNTSCDSSSGAMSALKNAALTGTSPSPASGMRRTESTCTITQSTRLRSHSSDSLSSDNSLDGSLGDANSGNFSTKINEKLTKNDTLTRQKQFDVPQDSNKTPHGLKALALWNNNLTKESGPLIADLLATTVSLELLNIGKNILCNDFVAAIRDSLSQNTTLTTLGLQSAHLSCAGIRTLSSILQFGGNNTLQRIDIRDNKIEVESLNMLAEALKSNTCVTQIDIDDEPKRLSIGSDAQLDYARVLENVRSLCSRNENQPAASATTDKAATVPAAKRRVGYYLGSRKISLTCHTAPPRAIIDQANGSNSNTTPTSSKLEVKKKTGVRLRSPIPSPPTISPSSSPVPSPSKSRFQVFRVSEVSPLTSPMSPSPSLSPSPSPTPLCTAKDVTGVLINSKDSTTTIKRLSTSPRSRFQVMKIYEDPGVPIAHRTLPPITPSPSPPTAPSITTPPLTRSSPSRAFEEPKIVTTPATPPIAEEEEGVKGPSFPAGTPTTNAATTTTTTTTTTDTKTNPNPLIVNNSTNTVKPNDQVDAATASSPPVPQDKVEKEEIVPQLAPTVEEDQRTLTNSSVNSCLINSIAVTTCSSAQELTITQSTASSATQELQESEDPHEPQDQEQELQPQPAAARARKVSWIQNSTYPGTVDRLLSIFQNSVFQRSSSPETTQLTSKSEAGAPPSEADQQSLVPVRKRSPPSATQLPAWCKLGTEICKPVTTVIQTAAAVSSGYTASGTTTAVVASSAVEGPLSFFDAASKQLRDFSKQVFRQNIAFGNEATNNSTLNQELPLQLHHDCDTIPSDVKLEIKENISPEHTINEEQLQTLQKIGGSPGSSSPSSSGTDTTEGASSTSSSPSSLLNAPLIGPSMASEVLAGVAEATAQSPHLTTEEQFCTS